MKKPRKPAVRFTAYITLRNGERLYAKSVGLKAFPIRDRKKK